jgi:hypothetical protein
MQLLRKMSPKIYNEGIQWLLIKENTNQKSQLNCLLKDLGKQAKL